MQRLNVAVIGWGRLGQACAAALHEAQGQSPTLVLAGIVRRAESLAAAPRSPVRDVPCVAHVRDLGALDVALLCVPTEVAPGMARELLQARVPLVECASLDGDALRRHHEELAHLAERHRARAALGAGWEELLPALKQLFELLIPHGHSQLGRHVGASLHHTAAAQGVAGVQDARCSELHGPDGALRRYVYVELAPGAELERVREQIEADPLFAGEPTEVLPVPDLAALEAENQGVLIERLGEARAGPHASLILEARLDPVAFTARLMLDAARSLARHTNGAWRYTPFGLVPLSARALGEAPALRPPRAGAALRPSRRAARAPARRRAPPRR